MKGIPVLGDYACHSYHWPKPEDVDLHHVVPRAWQNVWSPDGAPALLAGSQVVENVRGNVALRAMALPDAVLWHPETVRLTPSCHRAVHNRIVVLMKAFSADARRRSLPEAETLEHVVAAYAGRGKLWAIAERAPLAWLDAGGSLNLLADRRQWGDS